MGTAALPSPCEKYERLCVCEVRHARSGLCLGAACVAHCLRVDRVGSPALSWLQVITLEGWVEIMYYVMDAHSFYNFIYFILLIIVSVRDTGAHPRRTQDPWVRGWGSLWRPPRSPQSQESWVGESRRGGL